VNLIRVLKATVKGPQRGSQHPAYQRPPTTKDIRRQRATSPIFTQERAPPQGGTEAYQRWTAGRLCYPASLQLALIHEWYILAACGRVMTAIVQRRCSRDKSRYLSAEQIRWRPRS